MKKVILITGATSGIGKACAWKFAAAGYSIIATGRRADRLAALKEELFDHFQAEVITSCFDVRDKKAVQDAIDALPTIWKENIDVLINNAGLALGRDRFHLANMDDWETMIQTNVNGLLYVSRAILPFMIARNKGHIINIGSIAGKEVYENGNVYCGTKFAVDAISKSMRIDLLSHHIKVTAVHPGAVETEFSLVRYKGDEAKASATYEGYQPLTGTDVAESIFYCATLPEHVCINDLVITCTQQGSASHFNKNEPK